MGESTSALRSANSSHSIEPAGFVAAVGGPRRVRRQAAALFTLLFIIHFAVAVLTPLGATELGAFWDDYWLYAAGASLAWPSLLAAWIVIGPGRAAVRLPLCVWVTVALGLAVQYGLNRNSGESSEGGVVFLSALLLAFAVIQAPLWLIPANGRWRVVRARLDSATLAQATQTGGFPATKPASQFSLRALLGWVLAAAMLLAAFRAFVPAVDFDMLVLLLPETGLVSLLLIVTAPPLIALVWIILAAGRRLVLRSVLSVLLLLGIAGACGAISSLGDLLLVEETLPLEAGALLMTLVSLVVVRTCGYRVHRRRKQLAVSVAQNAPLPAPICRLRFAAALAPLVVAAVGLAASVPERLELWRRAAIRIDWRRNGLEASFANDGAIERLRCNDQPTITDELCRSIAGLGGLVRLDLTGSTIDDRQLALLAPLAGLENLQLRGTSVTDVGVQMLGQFRQLASLDLSNTQITDAGLLHLKALPRLGELDLSLTGISDEGLAALAQLPALQSFDVRLTAVSAEAAERFRAQRPSAKIESGASDALLRKSLITETRTYDWGPTLIASYAIAHFTVKVHRLHARGRAVNKGVAGLGVTDAGLASLATTQTELEELDLRESAVTDQGLWTLRTLSQLKRLDVRDTAVTEQGVTRLARALPECEIHR